jgi:SAM-dependent methyltransferase
MTISPDLIIRDLEIMAASVNYQKWIYDNIRMFLGKRIIELGAGIGNITRLLTDRDIVVAVDNSEAAVAQLRKRFSQFHTVIPVQLDIEGPELLTLTRYEADTIVCINVLEHMENDARVLSDMASLLKPGGTLILLVPAFQFLYGSIDQIVGHHKRYSRKELSSRLHTAGFLVREIYFMNSIAVFGWFLNNRILKRQEESPAQVAFFDTFVVPVMKAAEQMVRPPFGLSLIAIGQRT